CAPPPRYKAPSGRIHPRTTGLIILASSARLRPVRRCNRHPRTVRLSFFKASLLIAGRTPVKRLPLRPRAVRARNVYPRNVKDVVAYASRRLSSLQYTILVLSGCSRSPTCSILSVITRRTSAASRLLSQVTTASSAYLSNGTVGNLPAIHASKAECRNTFASTGETGGPRG